MIAPLPGVTHTRPGKRLPPLPRDRGHAPRRRRGGGGRGLPRRHPPLALHAAHDLGRRRALPRDLLVEVGRRVLPPATARGIDEGRLSVDPGPRGRRAERGRPPHRHHGGGERAGGAPGLVAEAAVVGKGPRGEGAGDCGLRDADGGAGRGATSWPPSSRRTSRARSGPSPGRRPSSSRPTCPRRGRGKIMRRLLGDIAGGRALGDTTTLADPAVVESLKEGYEARGGGVRVPLGVGVGSPWTTGHGHAGWCGHPAEPKPKGRGRQGAEVVPPSMVPGSPLDNMARALRGTPQCRGGSRAVRHANAPRSRSAITLSCRFGVHPTPGVSRKSSRAPRAGRRRAGKARPDGKQGCSPGSDAERSFEDCPRAVSPRRVDPA